jgi:hypothetical protein
VNERRSSGRRRDPDRCRRDHVGPGTYRVAALEGGARSPEATATVAEGGTAEVQITIAE